MGASIMKPALELPDAVLPSIRPTEYIANPVPQWEATLLITWSLILLEKVTEHAGHCPAPITNPVPAPSARLLRRMTAPRSAFATARNPASWLSIALLSDITTGDVRKQKPSGHPPRNIGVSYSPANTNPLASLTSTFPATVMCPRLAFVSARVIATVSPNSLPPVIVNPLLLAPKITPLCAIMTVE